MPYVAHAAIVLSYDSASYEKDKWYHIKEADNIEFRWRLNSNLLYEVIAGTFDEKVAALQCAKQMYVTLLYSALTKQLPIQNAGCDIYEPRLFDPSYDIDYCSYIDNESFFFWNPHYKGGLLGPGVYEVENSIDDFDKYSFISMTVSVSSPDIKLDLNNIDDYIFTYSREAQQLLSTVAIADNVCDYGMQMTMYCGLLEHLSESGYKDAQVISEIESLVDYVKCSELSDTQKSQIINPLNDAKRVSARQKCRVLLGQYARKNYEQFTAQKVLDEAYSIRSAFSHGSEIGYEKIEASKYMKYLVLDVIRGYLSEKEGGTIAPH